MRTTYIGIDPGEKSGSIAWDDGISGPAVIPMPESGLETIDAILNIIETSESADRFVVALEDIGNFVGSGKAVSSILKVKGHCRFSEGVVKTLSRIHTDSNIVLQMITPAKWQKAANIPPRRKSGRQFTETSPQFKRRLRVIAQERFPKLRITQNTADSLLIMQAGRALDLG